MTPGLLLLAEVEVIKLRSSVFYFLAGGWGFNWYGFKFLIIVPQEVCTYSGL